MEYQLDVVSHAGVEPQLLSSQWLRLIRGESDQPVWMVPSLHDGSSFSVGSGAACDWRVDGDAVPEEALHLRVLMGELFVRAEGDADVSVDGQRLNAMWVPVARGARILLGSAVVEVGLSGRSRRAQNDLLSASFGMHVENAEYEAKGATDDVLPHALGSLSEGLMLRGVRLSAPLHAALAEEERITPVLGEHLAIRDHLVSTDSAADHRPRAARDSAAAILEDEDEPTELPVKPWAHTGVWIAGSLVACAYGCWVLLLDYL